MAIPTVAPEAAAREPGVVTLILRPHMERHGEQAFHRDRFDAFLDGELICTSDRPLRAGACELLARGLPPDIRLNTRHEDRAYDNWAVSQPIGELAARFEREKARRAGAQDRAA